MSQWTDKHYNYTYKLTDKDICAGEIRVDAYFVAKVWKTGGKDDSGALWHCLKTIARFGDKNDIEREVKALYAQVKGLARSFDVELEDSAGKSQGLPIDREKDLPPMDNEYYNQACWYPDNSGEWIEYDGSGQPEEDDVIVEVLLQEERDTCCWRSAADTAGSVYWDGRGLGKIAAYKIVK